MNGKSGPFHILLADDDADDRQFFIEAMSDLKMRNRLTVFKNGQELMDYLEHPETTVPHILFLDLNMPCKTGIGGANVYIKKPNDFTKLKKAIQEVININWQYHSSGMNMETFFLTI